MDNKEKVYDLEERTNNFGIDIITLCKNTRINILTEPVIKQLIRSGTSVGANYLEANGASSKKDFCNKIYICKKEAQETRHWLRMLKVASEQNHEQIDKLIDEAKQLSMIFHKIASNTKLNIK
jgi:four helix bundle protein